MVCAHQWRLCVSVLTIPGTVVNVFEAVDIITLIKEGVYDDLRLTVGEALLKRSEVRASSLALPILTKSERKNQRKRK